LSVVVRWVANCWIVSSKCLNRVMRVWVCRVGGVFVLVVGVASASAPWLRMWMRVQNVGLEGLGGARAGLGGEVVGVEQGVGRRGRPGLAVGVGIGDRPQVPQRVSTASRVCGVGQVVVAGVAVADGHAGEGQYA
jgi:hypothetical protein